MANRVTQAQEEALLSTDNAKVRVTQSQEEALLSTDAAKVRATQSQIEALLSTNAAKARVTQAQIEALVNIATQVDADLVFDAIVRQLKHGDLAFDAAILQNVLTPIDADLTIDAAVNATAVGKNLTFAAKVTKATKLKAVGRDLDFRYAVLNNTTAGANLAINFTVEPFVGKAGADLFFDDAITINNLAGIDAHFSYEIDFNPDQVDADLGIDWTIAAVAGASLTFDAEISNAAPAVFIFQPIARAPRRRGLRRGDLSISAPIRERVGSGLVMDSRIAALASALLSVDSSIAGRVSSDLGMDATILPDFYTLNRDILLAEIDPDLLL